MLFRKEKADIIRVNNFIPYLPQDLIEVKAINEENINDGISFNSTDELEQFRIFLNEGHFGYYAYYNGQCALRTWIFTNEQRCFVGQNFYYKLPPGEYFSGWSKTHSEFRKLGLFTQALIFAINEHSNKTISGYVESNNIGSLKGTQKAGFISVFRFTLFKFGRLKIQLKTFDHKKGKIFKILFSSKIKP
jgi:hypothetical protein